MKKILLISITLFLAGIFITLGYFTVFKSTNNPATPPQENKCDLLVSQIEQLLRQNYAPELFDMCQSDKIPQPQGYQTYGCSWQVLKAIDPEHAEQCRIQIQALAFSPKQLDWAIHPYFAMNIAIGANPDAPPEQGKAQLDPKYIVTEKLFDPTEQGYVYRYISSTCPNSGLRLSVSLNQSISTTTTINLTNTLASWLENQTIDCSVRQKLGRF